MDGVLAHHGVKGMKWGVRKDAGHEGESAKTKKIAKLDRKFEGNRATTKAYYKTWNDAAKQMNSHDIARINNKPEYKNADFTKNSPLRQKYYAEHEKAFLNNLEKAASSMGTNASGTRKYTILENPNGSWKVITTDVKHDDVMDSFTVNVSYSPTGHIISVDVPDETMAQSADLISNVLAHHGIKGMKWGVRKGSSESSSGHVSEDHLVAEGHKSTIKEHGLKSLSNDDLQKLLTRMDLEGRYKTHKKNQTGSFDTGHNHVKKVIAVGKTVNALHDLAKSPVVKTAKAAYKVKKVAAG